jgi:dsRNA-specific ribonuclease
MNNIHNKLITSFELNVLLSGLLKRSIKVNDISLYIGAFMHKSFMMTNGDSSDDDCDCVIDKNDLPPMRSNERLEFLGDSVLNMVSAEYIFEKFPNKQEGFMTKLRTKLVRDTQLAHLGYSLGFNKWLLISNHIERSGGRNNDRLVEDIYESFLGALYKDLGFQITRDFIFRCFDKYIDVRSLAYTNDNYKDTLLRFFQVNGWVHPKYITVLQKGPTQNREFTTAVIVERSLCEDSIFYYQFECKDREIQSKYGVSDNEYFYIQVAKGKKKRDSEQEVSKLALAMMNVPKDF